MKVRAFFGSTAGLIAALALAGLGAWLLWSHTGHVLLAIPYLFLLACPLMHVMHRGHGHHSAHDKIGKSPDLESEQRGPS
jgi:uncharacterized membrane protein